MGRREDDPRSTRTFDEKVTLQAHKSHCGHISMCSVPWMSTLTPSQKGAIAEAEIAAAATRLGFVVLRPLCDGGRYDLGIDVGHRILRVQCKWASRRGDVLTVHTTTCRHTPQGYVRTTYSGDEIDAVAVYSADTDGCYLLPIADVERRSALSLRIAPTGNNQSRHVRWAQDYELGRSIERLRELGRIDAGAAWLNVEEQGDTMEVSGL